MPVLFANPQRLVFSDEAHIAFAFCLFCLAVWSDYMIGERHDEK